MKSTQKQMFYAAHRRLADANETFMMIVENGLTRNELSKLIRLRPALWSRFSHWLPKLP